MKNINFNLDSIFEKLNFIFLNFKENINQFKIYEGYYSQIYVLNNDFFIAFSYNEDEDVIDSPIFSIKFISSKSLEKEKNLLLHIKKYPLNYKNEQINFKIYIRKHFPKNQFLNQIEIKNLNEKKILNIFKHFFKEINIHYLLEELIWKIL